ncbi:hypothetical protein HID58_024701 [Brassica napus]|uniref:Uncharacterized protein n=1 Tax=Brassica napus TaxID=3708 RepID=A0ABQ8CIX7_BRANA|nr:hypothetical protein HID58_024701 [Brassica napus]
MTRRRHKVNDYVNRLKEILGTVPPACCMELPYFHGKVFFLKSDIGCIFVYRFLLEYAAELGDIIGSGRISNRLLPMYLACMGFGIVALLRGLVSHSTKRSPVLARRKRA